MKISKVGMLTIGGILALCSLSLVVEGATTNKTITIESDLRNAVQHINSVQFLKNKNDPARVAVDFTGTSLVHIGANNFLLSRDGSNSIRGNVSSILGGLGNRIIAGSGNTIIAGSGNSLRGINSVIGGGIKNVINGGNSSVIMGGFANEINGNANTIVGGSNNTITGGSSSAIAGTNNTVVGSNSIALGFKSIVRGNNSFLWSDSSHNDELVKDNVFVIYSDRGLVVNSESATQGAQLTVGGSLVVRGGSVDGSASCGNGIGAGLIKSVKNDSGTGDCLCTCNGKTRNSLYGEGRCEAVCKGTTTMGPECGSTAQRVSDGNGGCTYIGSCNVGHMVEGLIYVDKESNIYWICQTSDGSVSNVCKSTSVNGMCPLTRGSGCQGTVPGNNTVKSTVAPTGYKDWTYKASGTLGACEWTCVDGYVRDGDYFRCTNNSKGPDKPGDNPDKLEDEEYSCQGGKPNNSSARNLTSPSNDSTSWSYSEQSTSDVCKFHCDNGYEWSSTTKGTWSDGIVHNGNCISIEDGDGTKDVDSCGGTTPPNNDKHSHFYEGSDKNLTEGSNTTWAIFSHADAEAGAKCAYVCDDGYALYQGGCYKCAEGTQQIDKDHCILDVCESNYVFDQDNMECVLRGSCLNNLNNAVGHSSKPENSFTTYTDIPSINNVVSSVNTIGWKKTVDQYLRPLGDNLYWDCIEYADRSTFTTGSCSFVCDEGYYCGGKNNQKCYKPLCSHLPLEGHISDNAYNLLNNTDYMNLYNEMSSRGWLYENPQPKAHNLLHENDNQTTHFQFVSSINDLNKKRIQKAEGCYYYCPEEYLTIKDGHYYCFYEKENYCQGGTGNRYGYGLRFENPTAAPEPRKYIGYDEFMRKQASGDTGGCYVTCPPKDDKGRTIRQVNKGGNIFCYTECDKNEKFEFWSGCKPCPKDMKQDPNDETECIYNCPDDFVYSSDSGKCEETRKDGNCPDELKDRGRVIDGKCVVCLDETKVVDENGNCVSPSSGCKSPCRNKTIENGSTETCFSEYEPRCTSASNICDTVKKTARCDNGSRSDPNFSEYDESSCSGTPSVNYNYVRSGNTCVYNSWVGGSSSKGEQNFAAFNLDENRIIRYYGDSYGSCKRAVFDDDTRNYPTIDDICKKQLGSINQYDNGSSCWIYEGCTRHGGAYVCSNTHALRCERHL